MWRIERHPKLKQATETVFVGHSLGGTLAAILAIVNDSPAIVFNAPGWYLGTEWLCTRERGLEQSVDATHKTRLAAEVRKLCEMDPSVTYPVFNIFLQEDVLPHTFDYGLGYACPIPYERVQEAFILQPSLIEDIRKVKLFSLLDINFPAGLASCKYFEAITQLHDIFNLAFLECFGAAHHVQAFSQVMYLFGQRITPSSPFGSFRERMRAPLPKRPCPRERMRAFAAKTDPFSTITKFFFRFL